MNVLERSMRRVDAFQQRHRVTAFVFGVMKKYGDDNAGALAVQLTYSMFVTVFPLLLLFVTITGIVLAGDPTDRARLANSAFGEFPVVGQQLAHNVHALRDDSLFGLVVGLVGLAYGSTGLAQTGLGAMAQLWNIPLVARPGFAVRMVRSVLFLLFLAVGLIVTTGLSGFGTFGRHNVVLGYLAEVLAALVNVGLYLGSYRILTPRQVALGKLWRGAVAAGVAWTILQALGGYVVGHDLKGASATYGMFGLVLGLLAWIAIGAEVTLYAVEVNVVLDRRLYPRAMVQPPLTEADQRAIATYAVVGQRRPEQEVVTTVSGVPSTEDEYARAGYPAHEATRASVTMRSAGNGTMPWSDEARSAAPPSS